jgi:hypothetical protein
LATHAASFFFARFTRLLTSYRRINAGLSRRRTWLIGDYPHIHPHQQRSFSTKENFCKKLLQSGQVRCHITHLHADCTHDSLS